ncbi:MAG: hypothetical protein KBS56_02155 [Clostridiales bacterium]|nr:hypothetical protein [Candidatus Crickella equi]
MDNSINQNKAKQDTYAILISKLNKAIKNEFWFEACLIEYAIIEDRTSSILDKARVCENAYSDSKLLGKKLNSIEYQIEKGHPIISKKVDLKLIQDIKKWKDERNDLVHRACTMFDEEKAKNISVHGKELVRKLINDSAKVSRLAKKTYTE